MQLRKEARIEWLRSLYNDYFIMCKKNKYEFPSIPIEFILVGKKTLAADEILKEFLELLHKEYVQTLDVKDIELKDYLIVSIKDGKKEVDICGEPTNENLKKAYDFFLDDKVSYFIAEKAEKDHPKYPERHGNTFGEIDYEDRGKYFNRDYDNYQIKLTLIYDLFSKFSNKKKQELINVFKKYYCKLDATNLIISYFRDYEIYVKNSPVDIYERFGEYIPGCFWCNMIDEKQICALGGLESIKKRLNGFIVEEYTTSNDKQALYIQLTENDHDMTLEDLFKIRDVFLPKLLPVKSKNELFDKLKGLVSMGKMAQEKLENDIKDYQLMCQKRLLIKENDPRWR